MRCVHCAETVPTGRWQLGYRTCLPCGERSARMVQHCAVPLNKSNYMLVTDRQVLMQLNPKRTT